MRETTDMNEPEATVGQGAEIIARAEARRVRSRIARALALRAVAHGAAAGLVAGAAALFGIRLADPGAAPAILAEAFLATLAAGALAGLLLRRRPPSEAVCLAALEAGAASGGLRLVADRPGAEAWTRPHTATANASFRPSRALRATFGAGAAATVLAVALPDSVFRRVLPPTADPSGLQALAAREEDRLDALRDQGALSPNEEETLREWIENVAKNADAESPAATLEVLDHVGAELDALEERARAEAERMEKAQAAAEAIAEAIKDRLAKSDAARAALSNLLERTVNAPSGCCDNPQAAQEAAEELSKLCEGAGEAGDAQEELDEELAQLLEATGVPAHDEPETAVPLTWADAPASADDDEFRDDAVASAPAGKPTRTVGIDATLPDSAPGATPRAGALGPDASGPAGAGPAPAPILPRHRDAVRRYFENPAP